MTSNVEPDPRLEIAHILTIDVVAYSTLLMNEQSRLMTALNQTVRETSCFRKAESEGRLLRLPTGDGMVLVFNADAEAPLECAMQITAGLKEHPEIQLRMGIHSGPINTIRDVNDRVNVAGAGVDTAQRVMDCGDAGHILVSKRVADDLAPFPRWHRYLHELGECEVKHGRKVTLVNFYDETFGNPVLPQKFQRQAKFGSRLSGPRKLLIAVGAILCLGAAVLAGWMLLPSSPPDRSIAVLPFIDSSPAKDQEYFCDGITEQLINSLGRVHGLFVPSRQSSFAFKNRTQDLRDVGQKLHVRHVLEGSVSRGPTTSRVDVQLVDVSNGYQIWSETYDSSEKDLLTLQSDVAQKVAAALRVNLGIAESEHLAQPPTRDPEAYDLYLHGRYLLNKRTSEAIQDGLALFQRAVGRDPEFALGHAGIADSYILLCEYGVLSADEAAKKAWPEVTAALKINERLPEAYTSRASLFGDFEWKWDAAEADYRKAIELNPNSATAHHWYAFQLAQLGRNDEALREIMLAQKHDPLSPIIRAAKARILLVARRYQDAVVQCQKTLEMERDFAPAFSVLAQAYGFQKRYPEALAAAKKYVELSGGGDQERLELAYIQAIAGDRLAAGKTAQEVQAHKQSFSYYDMAALSHALGDPAAVFTWLEQAIRTHSIDVEWLKVDPRFDGLREQDRFNSIANKVVPPHGALK
ncbi:MAG: tetratricopeptide repeat protein [Gemmatimonadales bacterium]